MSSLVEMTIAFVFAEYFARFMNANNGAESSECLQNIIAIMFIAAVSHVLYLSIYLVFY